jgi:hypothetical protein
MRIFMLLVSLNLAVAAVLTPDACTIWAKPSHVAGVITAVANTSFEILAGPRVKERVRVRFDRRTDFVDCEPGDLEPGRDADIVGVRLGNGDFLAARVVINESGCPVRTPDGAILYHARADNGNDAKPVSPSPCSSAGSI